MWLKDENGRFGLPAFKIAGASWALERLLAARPGDALRLGRQRGQSRSRGRARGGAARAGGAHLPARGDERGARRGDRGRGRRGRARRRRLRGRSRSCGRGGARARRATLADVAYDESDPVAHWVSDGYSTIFAEAAEQADAPFDVVLCQIGVGAFASAAIRFACHQEPPAVAIGVEPATAACATASLAAGRPGRRRDAGYEHGGTQLRDALARCLAGAARRPAGCVVISDDEARTAMRDLAALGIVAGDCGAASLAALRALVRDPAAPSSRERAGLGRASRVLLISTEGATDPVSYAETMERT